MGLWTVGVVGAGCSRRADVEDGAQRPELSRVVHTAVGTDPGAAASAAQSAPASVAETSLTPTAPIPPREESTTGPKRPAEGKLPERAATTKRPEPVPSDPPPPPALPERLARSDERPRVVVNEILYHPESGAPSDEWIELFNASEADVDLRGWSLEGGVRYAFPNGARIAPGSYAIVAAATEPVVNLLPGTSGLLPGTSGERGAIPVFAPWTGTLDRGGGIVRLVDASGKLADEVSYDDAPPFPVAADGSGPSLERRSPAGPSHDAFNWGASKGLTGDGWSRRHVRGVATSDRLYIYLLKAGRLHVDDLTLTRVRTGETVPLGGDFERSSDPRVSWTYRSTHSGSRPGPAASRTGATGLDVSATDAGASSSSSVVCDNLPVAVGEEYDLEFWARYPSESVPFIVRFSRATASNGGVYLAATPSHGASTPGRVNSLFTDDPPPFVFPVSHEPSRPTATDRVTVRAQINSRGAPSAVRLHYQVGDEAEATVPLRRIDTALRRIETAEPDRSTDDREDGGAPEGVREVEAARTTTVYAAELGPFPPGTLVRYRVEAQSHNDALGRYPFALGRTKHLGFFIEPEGVSARVPIYHLFLPPASLRALATDPYSDIYSDATLVHDGAVYCNVGVRRRGHTSRRYPKHHWKIRFNKDHAYRTPTRGHRRVRSINLNSSFADKIYLREPLGYALFRDLGLPHCETTFVQSYLNGEYLGLYTQVENPSADYLERNGLTQGWLWKAYATGHAEGRAYRRGRRLFGLGRSRGVVPPNEQQLRRATSYAGPSGFELKAGDPARATEVLDDFLRPMNELLGRELEAFFRERADVEAWIAYLVGNQLIHNAEHMEKNYLVYAAPDGRISLLPWDLDLTHGRNFETSGAILNDQIRSDYWDEEYGDDKLLFGTLIHPKVDGPWNAFINSFLGKTDAFRKLYYERLAAGLRHHYHPDILRPKAIRLRELLREEIALDKKRWPSYGGSSSFGLHFEEFLGWIDDRYRHLESKLAKLGYSVGSPLNASFGPELATGPAPLDVHFTNSSVGTIDEYRWDFGDGTTSREPSPLHRYETAGRFDVTLEVRGPDGSHRTQLAGAVRVE